MAIVPCIILSIGAFITALKLIPSVGVMTAAAGLSGKDLNKKDGKIIPEGLGIVTGTVFLVFVILFQVFQSFQVHTESLSEYNAALTSICFMLLLGFSDDVLNLRWRYKLVLPAVATLPLLVAYAGGTTVVVPIPLRFILGKVFELGVLYKLYLLFLAIFCTNSINILAGINGLEVGQSFVIACAVITHNLVEISLQATPTSGANHTFSLFFMIPFIATTTALWCYNWFPSRVFVGDTFTYFSGMCFAVVAILCHFSKTLLLFFIPQIFNFVYSLPQLFHLVPCPRHRIPKYDDRLGKLVPTPNYTILNLLLTVFGPMTERQLCITMILVQDICCILGFVVRYYVSLYFF
eukprot:Phypoly_transcript_10886.p1 GENE.Phypoly_transcript_10886~~Phypoly_transcript_10886.p1  ORF type:complete len:392 (+),score=43.03 Phypoly_transcript_10886:127-1176(+)